eukprot:TRINITY_DN1828_c0_g1_i1.p2 TRINITY_DN1828_c0_g1~~TRINITY_DN1828_c0_g1_i1.p2  ORF type:complete len:271 (+),score=-18.26 TRINITY_DN1828_c0_g1_i1:683-1495(+)
MKAVITSLQRLILAINVEVIVAPSNPANINPPTDIATTNYYFQRYKLYRVLNTIGGQQRRNVAGHGRNYHHMDDSNYKNDHKISVCNQFFQLVLNSLLLDNSFSYSGCSTKCFANRQTYQGGVGGLSRQSKSPIMYVMVYVIARYKTPLNTISFPSSTSSIVVSIYRRAQNEPKIEPRLPTIVPTVFAATCWFNGNQLAASLADRLIWSGSKIEPKTLATSKKQTHTFISTLTQMQTIIPPTAKDNQAKSVHNGKLLQILSHSDQQWGWQ